MKYYPDFTIVQFLSAATWICNDSANWIRGRFPDDTTKMSAVWDACTNLNWLDFCYGYSVDIEDLVPLSEQLLAAIETNLHIQSISKDLNIEGQRKRVRFWLALLRTGRDAETRQPYSGTRFSLLHFLQEHYSTFPKLSTFGHHPCSDDEYAQRLSFRSQRRRLEYLRLVRLYKSSTPSPFL